MLKSVLLTCLLLSAQAYAGKCIVIENYNLDANRYAETEITAFNIQKVKIFREFVQHEYKILTSYSLKEQSLHENASSDEQLKVELDKLAAEKKKSLDANCSTYDKKLKNLLNSF